MPEDKPALPDLNLDKLERESAPKPVVIHLGGKDYQLLDAMELDFRVLVESQEKAMRGNPEEAISTIVAEAEREAFFANTLPSYKLQAMFELYNERYGIDPGELPASLR